MIARLSPLGEPPLTSVGTTVCQSVFVLWLCGLGCTVRARGGHTSYTLCDAAMRGWVVT